jgi:hypothetical protein
MAKSNNPIILKADSALRNIPVKISRDQTLFFDGIRFCSQMAALSYERLADELHQLSRPKEADSLPLDERTLVAALSDAWTIIDVLNRLRTMTLQMPGWKKKARDAQLFLQRTDAVETLRHFIQHLNNEVRNVAKTGMPLLGFVQWVASVDEARTSRSFLLYAGTVATFTRDVEISKIEPLDGSIGQVKLVAANMVVPLKPLVDEAVNLAMFCEHVLESEIEGGLRRSSDLLVGIDLDFVIPG